MNNQLLFLLFVFVLTTIIVACIPFLTRKTENFGVSIPLSMYDRADFKAMRKKYALILFACGLIAVLFLVIFSFKLSVTAFSILYSFVLIVFLIISFLLYLPFHIKMKQIKLHENWQADRTQSLVVNMKFRDEKLTYSNWGFIIPALIALATIVITYMLYDDIPGQIPVHTSINGEITYNNKSPGNVLILPVTQLFMIAIFLIVNYVIKHSKQQINAADPETSTLQNVLFRKVWSFYGIVMATFMSLLFAFLQMGLIFPSLLDVQDAVIFSTIGIVLLFTLALSVITGQGGSRLKVGNKTDDGVLDHDDDAHWKLGLFYFNKNDPSIFIEKRFGIGWTNNWAHPISWIILFAIILIPLVPILIFL